MNQRGPLHDRVTRLFLMVAIILGLAVAVLAWLLITRTGEREWLHNPVPQRITNTIPGVPGAAITLGDPDVSVEADKCNNGPRTLEVTGTLTWQSLDPRGTVVVVSTEGHAERVPGCTHYSYVNPVPEGVKDRTRILAGREGRDYVTWQLAGIEQAVGQRIAFEPWHTEPLRVYIHDPNAGP